MNRAEVLSMGRALAVARWAGHLEARLEDYQFVTGGDPYRLSARQAAERFNVTPRTIQRWRAKLRQEAAA